ncbi:MAG: peptidylprolyl isomerase [Cytophagaceae bacterium]|nr:peptidylprolyl isomerase [Cytophagaceae bacterium]
MKKTLMLLIAVLFSMLSCSDPYPNLEDGIYAEIVTEQGTMIAELYYEQTPATVANFVALAEGTHPMVTDSSLAGKPFYDGLTFHRIIKNFMIQGGDPEGTGRGGPGYKFHDEFVDELKHKGKGVLSMANSGPDTNGSQFFITQKETPWLDGKHTVWGQVVEGLDVIDKIVNVEMENAKGGVPKNDIIMQDVNIIRKGSAAKSFDAPAVFKSELAGLKEKRAKEAEEKAAAAAIKYKSYRETFEKKKAEATVLPSGLGIYYDQKGEGEKPNDGAQVKVNYAGFWETGELFDTNIRSVAEDQEKVNPRSPYQPMPMAYSMEGQIIAGFKEAVQQMRVGDKITAFIPAHLAYGSQGYGPIQPDTDILFELELVEIVK